MQYIFTCILPVASRILSVRMHIMQVSLGLGWHRTQCWLRSSKARDGSLLATTYMDCEPGTGDGKPSIRDGKPGTRDGASSTTRYGKPGTGDCKPGTGDGEPEPGTCNQGAPGPGTVCLLATTWTVSLVPGTASLAPVTVLCSVRVYM